jgi:hypothetical protein
MEKKNLPQLKDLYSGSLDVKRENDLNILLNHEPKKEWIRKHPIATNVKYIPIEVIEYLLTTIFIRWHVEIRETQTIANAIVVTVRLHYQNPIDGKMRFQDGIGAAPIQTAKDAPATDFTQVKSDAVMKAAPAAESYAIKDAAEKLGKLFGKDLNRKDAFGYDALGNKFDMATHEQENYISKLISNCTFDDTQIAELDGELFEGVTEIRANEIIRTLEQHQRNDDLSTQKSINKILDQKLDSND